MLDQKAHSKSFPMLAAGIYPPVEQYDVDVIILTRNRLGETIAAVDSALRQLDANYYVSILDQGSDPAVRETFVKIFRGRPNLGFFVSDLLTRNRLGETIAAVDSALRQLDANYYVSILDQGSDPAVRETFVKIFRGRPNLGFFVSDQNLGVGGGRNFLSAMGNGRYIIALDNDAEFADSFGVARSIKSFEESPALGAIGFNILSKDGVHLDEFSWGYPKSLKSSFTKSFMATTFVGAGYAVRRPAWTSAGGFDADLYFTWEEYDFSLRAIALGWRIKYEGAIAVIHKISAEARVRWASDRMRMFVRNRLIIARKWNFSWILLSPRICAYLVKAIRNRSLIPALNGVADAIARDSAIYKKPMNSAMAEYIDVYDGRFRDGLLRSFYTQILCKMRPES